MKVYKLVAILLLAGMSSAAFAQTPAPDQPTREDILKLFDAMHLRKQMDQLMGMMTMQVKQSIHANLQKQSPGLSPEEQAKAEARASDAMAVYPVSEMLDDIVPIYQRHMSKADVDGIVAFYASPAGQHLLAQAPVMMQESMATLMPKVNARVQAYIEKTIKEAGVPAPAAPPPPAPK